MATAKDWPILQEMSKNGAYPDMIEELAAAMPSGRYTTPEEIANMVLFLCSDLASNTTGGQFIVDGGRTATGGSVTQAVER